MHPPFLQGVKQLNERLFSAAFNHSYKLAKGQSLVIYAEPPRRVKTLFFFLTGNPGILPLYRPFLDRIAASAPEGTAVFGHALLGHVSDVPYPPRSSYTLAAHIDANVELLDALLTLVQEGPKVVLCGHSVGAWIMCEVAKRRPERVDAMFLLTPTLCHIADTPNGRRQRWCFSRFGQLVLPICARMLIPVAAYIAPHILPTTMQSRVDPAHWEMAKLKAAEFISNPSILIAALTLAYHEMEEIAQLDRKFLQQNREKIFCLFARVDNWVGDNRALVEEALGLETNGRTAQVYEDDPGIPHAFCFEYNHQVADICLRWLREHVVNAEPGPEEIVSKGSPRELIDEAIM